MIFNTTTNMYPRYQALPMVFLGGTCNESTWRDKIIPLLKINYFNPVVDDWNEEAQKLEELKKANADIRAYCITPLMTGVYSIAEVVDDSNKYPEKTVLCVLKEDNGKEFTEGQMRSLNQVMNMVKSNGGKVCTDLDVFVDILNSYEK